MLREFLTQIANALRSKLGTTEAINAQDFPDKVGEVFDAGKQAQYEWFWSNFDRGGYIMVSAANFSNQRGWNDETFNPPLPIYIANNTSSVFAYNTGIVDTKVNITISGTSQQIFYGCTALKTIRKLIVNTASTYGNMFYNCTALVDLLMEGTIAGAINLKWSKKLSKASFESVIGCLSNDKTGLTATFSTTAVNKAFETSEGANDGSTSAEWNTLVASKPNWTIALTEA